MAPPHQKWFWGLIAALLMVLVGGVTVTTYLFMQAPRLPDTTAPEVEGEEPASSVLPYVSTQEAADGIGERLPAETRWVMELQIDRGQVLQFSSRAASVDGLRVPPAWQGVAEKAWQALPFDSADPRAWLGTGYAVWEPWALAWVREDAEDAGAWVLLLPVSDLDSARATTLGWLEAWDLGERRVAWTWDASYHIIVIEESASRAPEERIKALARATREQPLSGTSQAQALVSGMGGQWTARLRCLGAGVLDWRELWGQAWPLGIGGPGTDLGLAIRVEPDRQRLRMALVGADLAAIRVNQEMSTDPLERTEIAASELPTVLSLDSTWRESLRAAGSEVNSPLESAQVTAELGPSGLIVDLRSSRTVDEWEPLIRWWTSQLN